MELDVQHNERAGYGIDDPERTIRALGRITGKRLTYQDSPKWSTSQ